MLSDIGMPYKLGIAAALALLLIGVGFGGCYYYIYLPERDAFVKFTAEVKTKGEDQIAANARQAAADKLSKENTDAQIKSMGDMLATLSSSLYNSRSSRGYSPAASPGSKRPDTVCYDRAKFDAAMGYIDAEGTRIAKSGSGAQLDLYNVCLWSKNRR
jgi:hypothetical protein